MISEGDILDLKIEELGFGARGLGRLSSFVIWVDGALPGDIVRVKITGRKPNYAEARILEFLEYSEERVQPRCKQHARCGGCQLLELQYESQLDYKEKQLKDALERIGKQSDFIMRAMVPSPEMFRYRNRMEFSFGFGGNGDMQIGLHLPECSEKIEGLNGCHLQSQYADRILRKCGEFFSGSAQFIDTERSPNARHLLIREGRNTGEFLVAVTAPAEDEKITTRLASELVSEFPQVKTFIFRALRSGAYGKSFIEDRIIHGDGTIEEKVESLRFMVNCDSFFQANTKQTANLLRIVKGFAGRKPVSSLLDLYCGSGSLSLFLSDIAHEVMGIDLSEPSVHAALHNARKNGSRNCRYQHASSEEGSMNLLDAGKEYDLVVTNPSRSGMSEKALHNLTRLSPARIIYVSCNPSTLARDLKILKDSGYLLVEVVPVDMFPHTYHIESVSYLTKP